MGTLSSFTDWTGRTVAGCVLGQPALEAGLFVWDGPEVPTGVIGADGLIDRKQEIGKPVAVKLLPDDAPLTASEKAAGAVRIVVDRKGSGSVRLERDDGTPVDSHDERITR